MDRYVVESSGIGYLKGKRVEIPVTCSYNLGLDSVFGYGYALKCAKITARQNWGRLYEVTGDHKKPINV